jgi:hypothetical protein
MKRDLRHVGRALAGLGLISLLACAPPEVEEAPPEIAELKDALWADPRFAAYWPNGVIPVCVSRRPDWDLVEPALSTWDAVKWARFDAAVAHTRQVVEDAFEHLPNVKVDFTGWQRCSDVPNEQLGNLPGTLRLVIQIDKPPETAGPSYPVFRQCAPGHSARPYDCSGANITGYSTTTEPIVFLHDRYAKVGSEKWAVGALHEFGHALGFSHELDRDDNQLGQLECPDHAKENMNSGDYLTRYDQDSIMNATYCHMNPALSELDELGLEIAYPDRLTAPFRGEHSFTVAAGLLVRADDHLVPEWLLRGADTLAFDGEPTWASGLISQAGWRFPALRVAGGTATLEYDDYRQRTHRTAQFVEIDDAAHTALLLALL